MIHLDVPGSIFRGSFSDCLTHYLTRLTLVHKTGSQEITQARAPMAAFTGVNDASVSRWLREKIIPQGITSFKVMVFLSLNGYEVIELERMKIEKRQFVELLAFNLVSLGEAIKLLGMAHDATLIAFLRNSTTERGQVVTKLALMYEKWKELRSELENRKASYKFVSVSGPKPPAPTEPLVVAAPEQVVAAPIHVPQVSSSTSASDTGAESGQVDEALIQGIKLLNSVLFKLCADKSRRAQMSKPARQQVLQLAIVSTDLSRKIHGEDPTEGGSHD